MTFVLGVVRCLVALGSGAVVFLGVARNGCDEQASCNSFLGNTTPDWPYAVPALIALVAAAVAYALLGALRRFWRTYAPLRDTVS